MINNFDFSQPMDLPEALRIFAQSPRAVPLAGGTNVMVNLKRTPLDTDLVVDISRLDEMSEIRTQGEELQLGAGVTFARLLDWKPGGALQGLIQPMSAAFAGPLIRNLATVGGNLCDASPAADVSPPLLALGAEVKLESQRRGARWLSLPDFFKGVRKTAREADELLTTIRLPLPDAGSRTFYYKLGKRRADAISIVSVALVAGLDAGRIEGIRIALGAVAPVAMRALRAEAILQGQLPSETVITAAARAAAEECRPIDDFRASAAYRREMVEVLVARGLRQILK